MYVPRQPESLAGKGREKWISLSDSKRPKALGGRDDLLLLAEEIDSEGVILGGAGGYLRDVLLDDAPDTVL